jgi:Na+/melibiose symporter-like transporter
MHGQQNIKHIFISLTTFFNKRVINASYTIFAEFYMTDIFLQPQFILHMTFRSLCYTLYWWNKMCEWLEIFMSKHSSERRVKENERTEGQ